MPDDADITDADVDAFIARREASGASERGNHQLFLSELCEQVLGVAPPQPARSEVRENTYVFERAVHVLSVSLRCRAFWSLPSYTGPQVGPQVMPMVLRCLQSPLRGSPSGVEKLRRSGEMA